MSPYLSFLLSSFIESLRVEDSIGPVQLSIVQTLTKSMNVDEGGWSSPPFPSHTRPFLSLNINKKTAFWRDDRLQQLMPVLTSLIPHADAPPPPSSSGDPSTISNDGSGSSSRDIVSASLVALCDAATDDALLKQLNLAVLMHTRADDAHVRIFALRCARALWSAHGRKLIGKEKDFYLFI